jgi:CheY-like chemotaxis protein
MTLLKAPANEIKLLLVEDDLIILTMMSKAVEAEGFKVLAATSNVVSARESFKKNQPDVAILDIDLGAGPTGIDLANKIRKTNHRVAIVFCTSYKDIRFIKNESHYYPPHTVLLKKADIVIPLAALVGAPLCNLDPVGATTINHDAITLMIKLLSKEQIVLMPTTNSAYGTGDTNNFCTEESLLRPISQYAIEKVAIEKELMQRENAISFRLATVFGISPRMRIDLLVNDFTYRAVNDRFVVLFENFLSKLYLIVMNKVVYKNTNLQKKI